MCKYRHRPNHGSMAIRNTVVHISGYRHTASSTAANHASTLETTFLKPRSTARKTRRCALVCIRYSLLSSTSRRVVGAKSAAAAYTFFLSLSRVCGVARLDFYCVYRVNASLNFIVPRR